MVKWGRDKTRATGNATGDPNTVPEPVPAEVETEERDPRGMSPDELRVLWRESPDYIAFKRVRWRGLIISLIVAVLVGTGAWLLSDVFDGGYENRIDPQSKIVVAIGMAFALLYAYVAMALLMEQRARRRFNDRVRFGLVENLQRRERKLAEEAKNGQLDLASLWAANQERIDTYHEIATSQADSSFKVGQWAMIAGFGVVVVLGFVAAFAKDGTASIAASVAGVAGAALSAYIGSTFMKAQTEASKQLSQFFLQPVEFARLLGAERLLETLDKSERTVAVQRVIETIMIAPGHVSAAKKETKGDDAS